MASKGPIHSIDAIPTTFANTFPALDNTLSSSPPHFAAAVITKSDKPTSANINPDKDINQ